jgi:hypothetical protein
MSMHTTGGFDMSWFTRRRFVQTGLAAGGLLGLHAGFGTAHAAMGGKLVKYLEPLPRPGAGMVMARPGAKGVYTFTQRAIVRQLHPQLPPTPMWAYDDGSGLAGQAGLFGMIVQANSGTPVGMKFIMLYGAAIAFSIASPPIGSAGKNWTTDSPLPKAISNSVGVHTPGTTGRSTPWHYSTTAGLNPGATTNRAPGRRLHP